MKPTRNIIVFTAIFIVVLVFSGSILAEDPPKININTATVDELVQLDQIGPQYAQRIVDYREKEGPFAAPEDLMKVKGIGEKAYEANKEKIVVK
ncbi:MAG: helix-hairpin-helix domain-containing protein [Proteobacteria bacterium]|nr:helix-hairpin-helix domain-containing protein [Pseudomonadota bacterium]MBU4469708.1 helix-hairpin-helix domain-containing protein [Pseudomonadota bacterium]MCG2751790.1 helix-hairpin-helix domain-containing protein [Desulfobacteraceae bacterium]